MTIAKTGSEVSYAGNGATVAFAFPFRFFDNTDLQVFIVVDATGASTLQTLTTDYTVVNAGDETGGTVTMVTAPATGETLLIQRQIPETQSTDYQSNDAFPAETHEAALDRLTLIDQQRSRSDGQHLTFPTGDTSSPILPISSSRANKIFGFDSAGNIVMADNGIGITITYDTRAEFAAAIASGLSVADGFVVPAGEVMYQASNGSTDLPNLPGWVVFGTLTPLHFGAAGDNTTDDATAMQALIDHLKVFQNPTNVGILDDDVPQVVDLMGKSYVVGTTLDLADLYYVTFQNGQIIADSGAVWGANDYVLYIARPQATDMVRQQRIRAVTFDNVKIHGNAVANCVYLENTYEVVLSNLYILDWVSGGYGVRTSDRSALPVTKNTHLKILNVTASQKELSQSHVGDGTALYIETADFMMDNVTVFKAAVGLHLNGFSNGQISNFHSFVDAANICWFVGPNCNHIVFNNVYSDTGRVVHQSFNHTYSGGIFGSSSVIELDAVDTVGEDGNGLTFVGGLFVNNPSYTQSGTGNWANDKRISFLGCRRTGGGHVFGSGIETGFNGALALVSNDTQRFLLNGSGDIVPATGQGGALDIGEAGNTLRRMYARTLFIGSEEVIDTGGTLATPEGNVVAPPSSTYRSSTGGAGATWWVKETGTGNTGWVAK